MDDSRWQRSNAKKENTEEEWQYVGEWEVEEPTVLRGEYIFSSQLAGPLLLDAADFRSQACTATRVSC